MSDDLKRLIQELPDALSIPKASSGTEIMNRGLGRRSRSRLLTLAATATTVGLVWIALFHYSWGTFAHEELLHVRAGGHSTVAFTMDVYSHAIPAMQADAADLIARAVWGDR